MIIVHNVAIKNLFIRNSCAKVFFHLSSLSLEKKLSYLASICNVRLLIYSEQTYNVSIKQLSSNYFMRAPVCDCVLCTLALFYISEANF